MEIERAPHNQQRVTHVSMPGVFWWIWQVILTLAGSFFLFFGIHLLITFRRKHEDDDKQLADETENSKLE